MREEKWQERIIYGADQREQPETVTQEDGRIKSGVSMVSGGSNCLERASALGDRAM